MEGDKKNMKELEILENCYVPLVKTYIVKERLLPYGKEEICTPQKVVNLLSRLVSHNDREKFIVISCDTRCKPVGVEVVSVGVLNAALVEAREVFKHSILCCSAAIILVHTHPSGDVTPSRNDWEVTKKMYKAGEILGIPVVDHIIIGDKNNYLSLAQTEEWKELVEGA